MKCYTPQDKLQIESIMQEISSDEKAPKIVPARLSKPDIITANTIQFWLNRDTKKNLGNSKTLLLPIRVEKNNERRALLFMDTFVKLLRYR